MGQPKHESWWIASAKGRKFPPLDRDLKVDVAIIGGGITGLTAAWALKQAGKTVAVFERHELVVGETGHTTAHLTQAFDTGLAKLRDGHGDDGARAVWDAGRWAIDAIERTCREQGIDAEFARVPGYYFARRAEDRPQVEEEARLARELGYDAAVVDDAPFPPMRHGAMRLANQARFHPRKYLLALAEKVDGDGSHVLSGCSVDAWTGGDNDQPWRLTACNRAVMADHLVFATHQPIHDTLFAAKTPAWQTYAIAWEVAKGALGDALAWDTADPYHYWRVTPAGDHDLVIVGGCDHRTGQEDAEAAFARLTGYAEGILGKLPHRAAWRWSGQWLEPVDGAPYIGPANGMARAYVATGYGGNGMTMGTYAGHLIADLIRGVDRPDAAVFDPSRLKLRAGAITFLTENLAYPAYLLMDRLGPTEKRALDDLKPGEGAVVALGGEKAAASRDADGKLHVVSAICTHMGCVVHWNDAETSWDCPCHGSRFMPDGTVMSGPARASLPPCQLKKQEGTNA